MDGSEYFLHIIEDLTGERALHEAIQEIEESYRNIIEDLPVGICIFQDGKFVFVNREITRMTGYSKAELYNLNPFSLIHPNYVEKTETYTRYALAGEKEKLPEYFIIKLIRKDGSELWAEIKYTRINFRGKEALLVSVVDVTEIKKLKEKIKGE